MCLHSAKQPNRRSVLAGLAVTNFATATAVSSSGAGATRKQEAIIQPSRPSPASFIERAFEMQRQAVVLGDQAYGAVVVIDRTIVGQSWSRVVLDSDPTGHAEMSALRDAGRRLNRQTLSGAVLYSSSRPCSMCEAAAGWVGIVAMIHGRNATDAGRPKPC